MLYIAIAIVLLLSVLTSFNWWIIVPSIIVMSSFLTWREFKKE